MSVPGEDPQSDRLPNFNKPNRKILITASGQLFNTNPAEDEMVEGIIEERGGFVLEWIDESQGVIKFKFCGAWTVDALMQTMIRYENMIASQDEGTAKCIIDLSKQDPELFPGLSVIRAFPRLYDIFKLQIKFMLIVIPNFDSMIATAAKMWNSTVMRQDSEVVEVDFNYDRNQLVAGSLKRLSERGLYTF